MTHKAAYLWGPLSTFSGPLAAHLLTKGWNVHIASKSALHLFSLAPLDLKSSAQYSLERALGGHEKLKTFQERLTFLEGGEPLKGTTYDALIFCGLPPNFDEPRAPRAPWAAGELLSVARMLKGVPLFIVSSLWGGIQADGVVPEELEFDRRKPKSHWEGVCQQYESRLLKDLAQYESAWHLVRLPVVSGSSLDGHTLNFSGLFALLRELARRSNGEGDKGVLQLGYNPDATLWFLPVDAAVHLFWRILEDEGRPRLCNLVSTQQTLNREWLASAARALGFSEIESVETDSFSLPGTLRHMLKDSMLVKTRNLFEVAGRYQIQPPRVDQAYFERMLSFAQAENWGSHAPAPAVAPEFTDEAVREYFEKFLPAKLSPEILKGLTPGGKAAGFAIEGDPETVWLLTSVDGRPHVEPSTATGAKPRMRLLVSRQSLMRLATGRTSLHREILLRSARIDGPLLDAFKFANALAAFLKEHPFVPTISGLPDQPLPTEVPT
ncbi:MAG TPA: hypothetical protein V6D08_02360 [Candidatus Obscuribacterales bacterium]